MVRRTYARGSSVIVHRCHSACICMSQPRLPVLIFHFLCISSCSRMGCSLPFIPASKHSLRRHFRPPRARARVCVARKFPFAHDPFRLQRSCGSIALTGLPLRAPCGLNNAHMQIENRFHSANTKSAKCTDRASRQKKLCESARQTLTRHPLAQARRDSAAD